MAAPAATIANLSAGLKRRYSTKFVSKIEWSKGAAAAMVPKVGWSGQPTWAMRVGNNGGGSADFATAQTNGGAEITNIVQPVISTYQQDYGVATIEGRLMAAASDKEGALYDKMVAQIDGIMGGTMQSFATKIYRSGFGEMSTIGASTTLASTSLVLAFPEDAVLFEIGMRIQFSQTLNANLLRNSGGTTDLRITAIDYNTGTLTTSANISSITGVALGDFIFRKGDRQDSATPSRLAIVGFEGQFNMSDTIFGYPRSTDSRLRGVSINSLGKTEEDAIIDGLAEVDRYGGQVDWVFMNPTRRRNLTKLAMGRYRPTTVASPIPGVGVKGINLMASSGDSIDIFSDPFCPVNRIYGVSKESLQLFCARTSQIPTFLDDDGNTVLRLAAADGIEGRVGYYADLGCNAPIHNFCLTF